MNYRVSFTVLLNAPRSPDVEHGPFPSISDLVSDAGL